MLQINYALKKSFSVYVFNPVQNNTDNWPTTGEVWKSLKMVHWLEGGKRKTLKKGQSKKYKKYMLSN